MSPQDIAAIDGPDPCCAHRERADRLAEALDIAVGTLMLIRSAETFLEARRLAFDGMCAAVDASGCTPGSFNPDAANRALGAGRDDAGEGS
jgi:hypothetical protein